MSFTHAVLFIQVVIRAYISHSRRHARYTCTHAIFKSAPNRLYNYYDQKSDCLVICVHYVPVYHHIRLMIYSDIHNMKSESLSLVPDLRHRYYFETTPSGKANATRAFHQFAGSFLAVTNDNRHSEDHSRRPAYPMYTRCMPLAYTYGYLHDVCHGWWMLSPTTTNE